MITVSPLYISILVLYLTILNFYVIYQRNKTRTAFGDGGHESLIRARSAHSNSFEFSVLFSLVLLTYDLLGGVEIWMHILGFVFIFARLLHGHVIVRNNLPFFFRVLSTALSHIVITITIILILVEYFS